MVTYFFYIKSLKYISYINEINILLTHKIVMYFTLSIYLKKCLVELKITGREVSLLMAARNRYFGGQHRPRRGGSKCPIAHHICTVFPRRIRITSHKISSRKSVNG